MRRWTNAALVGLLMLAGCDDAPPRPTTPSAPAPQVADLAVTEQSLQSGCPRPRRHLPYAPQGLLPRGATLVRLCNGWQHLRSAEVTLDIAAPREALVLHPDRLVDLVNASLPPEPRQPGERTYCSADLGPTMEFWFGYPGGHVAAVRWRDYGCGLLRTGAPADVQGGARLLKAFAALLARQRRPQDWRWFPHPPPGCNPTSQPVSPLGARGLPPLAAVRWCTLDAHNRWRQAVVPPRLVERINSEMTHEPGGRCPVDRSRSTMFRALTTHDDRVEMWWANCGWTLPHAPHALEPLPSWQPSAGLVRALDRLPLSPPFVQRDVAGHAVGRPS